MADHVVCRSPSSWYMMEGSLSKTSSSSSSSGGSSSSSSSSKTSHFKLHKQKRNPS